MRAFVEQLPDDLTAAERSLLFVLRIRVGDNSTCYPSQRRLVRETGVPERTLRRATESLERRGLLRVVRHKDDRRAHDYSITIPAAVAAITHDNNGHRDQNTGQIAPELPATVAAQGIREGFKEGVEPHHVIEAWNSWTESSGLKSAIMTLDRQKALQEFIGRTPPDEIRAALRSIHNSAFLTGKTKRPFRANFDWLLNPNNLVKLREGAYD